MNSTPARAVASSARKTSLSATTGLACLALFGAVSLGFGSGAEAQTLPTGGIVSAGGATISTGGNQMTVNQSTQNAAINWQSFSIGAGSGVTFVQPNSSSVALNRVTGPDASAIFGSLSANGTVFLVNPNGVLFGQGAQVNVGALTASTLGLSDADFMAGNYSFKGSGPGTVLNQGTITAADGGYVALLGARVNNEGVIQANLGTVALAAGGAITLDVAGDGLLSVAVDTGAVNALIENGGLLRADGGKVLMTAQAAGDLLRTVVNNTGVIEARTLGEREGSIVLLGDMKTGVMTVGGVLDASAPNGGRGGFIETSAAHVNVTDGVRVTTLAASGHTGTWLIDPQDYTIGAGGNISGATLSAQLVTTNVTISTITGPGAALPGNGDIHVNDAIAWTASSTPTTLTMNGARDVNINASITATNGNLVVCCGRDINVNAPITTTNGSVLLNAGRNVNVFGAMTTTNGNIALCAGHDVRMSAALTLTDGSTITGQSLNLPVGLTIIVGADGSGPGVNGGTLIYAPLAPPTTVTDAPATINYNPVSYAAPSDYSINFVLTEGATLTQRMLLFPNSTRVFNGATTTTLSGFRTTAASGLPAGVTLVAGPGASATYDSAAVGTGVGITYSGYSLGGANADQYALAGSCCVSTFRTQGTITAAPVVVVPPVEPPVIPPVIPPVVPPVIPPVVVPPVVVVVPPIVPPSEGGGSTSPTYPGAPPVTVVGGGTLVGELPLTVVDSGVNVPTYVLAEAPVAPAPEAAVTPASRPVMRPIADAPVYLPKQDRN